MYFKLLTIKKMNFFIRLLILCALFFMQSCVVQKDMKHLMSANYLLDLKNTKTSLSQNIQKDKPYVVIFIATDCPICQRYVSILRGIADTFQDIKFIMVFSKWETLDDIKTFKENFIIDEVSRSHPVIITLLQDTQNTFIKNLKATTTPEAFFYDINHKLQYRGAIDNWFFALGRYRPQATEHYLKNALTQYLKNEKISVSKTNPIGCLIEY